MTLNRRELLVAASAVVVGGVGGKVMPLAPKQPDPVTGYIVDEKLKWWWACHRCTLTPKPDGGLRFLRVTKGGREYEDVGAVRFWYLYIQALHGGKFENGASFFRGQAVKQLQESFGDDPRMLRCLTNSFGLNPPYQGK